MKLKTILDLPCGMRFIFSEMEFASSFSGQVLLDSVMNTTPAAIEGSYNELREFLSLYQTSGGSATLGKCRAALLDLRDIRNTLTALESGKVPDDVELFEIKNLALISEKVREILAPVNLKSVNFPDLADIVSLLDPEGHGIPSFYIYDSFDSKLSELRKKIRNSGDESGAILAECLIIEARVREMLGNRLKGSVFGLREALMSLAKADILISKSILTKKLNLIIPEIATGINKYSSVFNPEISAILSRENKTFQKVNIELDLNKPTILTGANMGGKSVVLKTLALSQFLFQFGFGVPAASAEITPVEEIHYSPGDLQDMTRGLSSFAAEMKMADRLIKNSAHGHKILALLDEPARTTNPQEGTALVTSLLNILNGRPVFVLVATHYNVKAKGCARIRVKGLEEGKMNYELIEAGESAPPREAVNIALSLGIDREWLDEAIRVMDEQNKE